MNVGTKSILFGVHAFWWHWLPVTLAWRKLQKRWPTWWEFVAIFCHDLGYIFKPNMDGPEGETHPEIGAELVWTIVNFFVPHRASEAWRLALHHSRFYAARDDSEPSALCWADKLSVHFEPVWWYLLRAHLSGEVHEYVHNAPLWVQINSRVWLDWYRKKAADVVEQRRKAQSRYV